MESKLQTHHKSEDYDGIFTSPLSKEIHNFLLPPDFKTPKFKMFGGVSDPEQHLTNYQEYLLKLKIE